MAKVRGRWNIGLFGEAMAVIVAVFDRRTPFIAKLLAGLVLVYLVSPIDFISGDIFTIVGLVDDALIVPLGLWLASRLVPADVMDDARARFSRDKIRPEVRPEPRNVTPVKPRLPAK